MLTQSIHRFSLFVLVAFGAVGNLATEPAFAGECDCESVCVECPPNGCDCPCDCGPRLKFPTPIYKALDAVAGGIEKVLGLDQIHCGSSCDDGCDEVFCDDGCDAATLYEMAQPIQPQYQDYGQPIDSAPHALPSPPVEFVPREYRSHDLYQQNQSPQMQMGEPTLVEPHPMSDPGAITPPIHPQEALTNPFLDDARVTSKRRIQPTSYQRSSSDKQSNGRTDHRESPARQQDSGYSQSQRNSRSYAPSERLARTDR